MATSKKATKKTETKKVAAPKKVTTTRKPLSTEKLTPIEEQQGVEAANKDAETETTEVSTTGDAQSIADVLKKNRQT